MTWDGPAAPRNERTVDLSLVIPAYNEAGRLPVSLEQIAVHLSASTRTFEVLVVDDGSSDGTSKLAIEAGAGLSLRCLRLQRNSGKGAALRAGFAASRGRIVAFTDADLSAPIEQLTDLIDDLRDAEVAILSRALPGAQLVRRQSWPRELLGRSYARVARALVLRGVPDAHCGLKAFRGDQGRAIFATIREDGVLFDLEALLVATIQGHRISQRPARWSHHADTRIRFTIGSASRIALGLLSLRRRYAIVIPPRARGPIRSALAAR